MIGRANRAQGTQSGHVFVATNIVNKKETNLDYFKSSEKKMRADIGAPLAGAIMKLWDHLTWADQNNVINVFGG